MSRRNMWFLPEAPDVISMLGVQVQDTLVGIEAFSRWADSGGDPEEALAVRSAEHNADKSKLALRLALRSAFSTALDSEDVYMISERLDNVINEAKNTVRESELMRITPDQPTGDMTERIVEGVRHLDTAVENILAAPDLATAEADAATKCARRVEKLYRSAAAELVDETELRVTMARRELYRGTLHVAEHMVSVSERVWYAVVKEA